MTYRVWYFEDGNPVATTEHSNQFNAVYCAGAKTRFRHRDFIVVRDGDSEVLAASVNAPTNLGSAFEGEPANWFRNWVAENLNAKSHRPPTSDEINQINESTE